MRKRLTTIILGGAAALTIGLTATAASATTSGWTVKPGGKFSSSGSDQVKDTKTGTIAKCSSVKMSGTLKTSSSSGSGLGTITTGSFSKCDVGTIGVSVAVKGLPWKLNVTSDKNGVISGSISGIELVATGPGCSATLDGTSAGAHNGVADASYSDSSGKLTLTGKGNLHSYAVSGCLGLINNGDPQDASGTNTVTPKQDITGP